MQCVGIGNPALFSPAEDTMQLFMWQRDIVGVAHNIMDQSMRLAPLMMFPDFASILSSSALAAG